MAAQTAKATDGSRKKPTVVFSRKDTLNPPDFSNVVHDVAGEEHLIHSIDKQNAGDAVPPPPPPARLPPTAAREESCLSRCFRSIFCCCSNKRHATYARPTTTADIGPAAASNYGSLGFPPTEGKPTLVLDLDETLVHSSFKAIPNPDFVIPVNIEGQVHHVYVLERPGTHEFLQRMNEHYEIICFTASLSKYANPLLDLLDKDKTICGRLYREHCVYYAGTYVKDLSLIGRELSSTLIVDNSKASFMFQPECGIPCTNFIDDKSDRELYALADWLETVATAPDMTKVTPQWVEMWEREFNGS